ncbi:hypothetical protein CLV92_105286 [Kineococcus xinjiangensis]|uniref:Htaa protein n=1 Tax=Kineococcus xinjiangensis TaxID=512762 RepID=A0A2S6IPK0_9ACTN|nr:hypothetical protein [Kineococcus xinjiangensis]PPK96184.1 hypothetical protein CLV92_105286 [Kineococcus xinjiangensis]
MTFRTAASRAVAALVLPTVLLSHAGAAAAAPPGDNSRDGRTTQYASLSFIENDPTDALGLPGNFHEGAVFITRDAQGTRLSGGMLTHAFVPNTNPDDEVPDGELGYEYLGYHVLSSTEVTFTLDAKTATYTASATVTVTDDNTGQTRTWPLTMRLRSIKGMETHIRDQSWSDGENTYRAWTRVVTSGNAYTEGALGPIDFAIDADDFDNPYWSEDNINGSFETSTYFRNRPGR